VASASLASPVSCSSRAARPFCWGGGVGIDAFV
jgi:hypothetical protein